MTATDPIRDAPPSPTPEATSDAEWHHQQQALRQELDDANRRSFDAAQAWADGLVPPWATRGRPPQKPGR